jgi:hypothetical protein
LPCRLADLNCGAAFNLFTQLRRAGFSKEWYSAHSAEGRTPKYDEMLAARTSCRIRSLKAPSFARSVRSHVVAMPKLAKVAEIKVKSALTIR